MKREQDMVGLGSLLYPEHSNTDTLDNERDHTSTLDPEQDRTSTLDPEHVTFSWSYTAGNQYRPGPVYGSLTQTL